jgi:hypothetical protein
MYTTRSDSGDFSRSIQEYLFTAGLTGRSLVCACFRLRARLNSCAPSFGPQATPLLIQYIHDEPGSDRLYSHYVVRSGRNQSHIYLCFPCAAIDTLARARGTIQIVSLASMRWGLWPWRFVCALIRRLAVNREFNSRRSRRERSIDVKGCGIRSRRQCIVIEQSRNAEQILAWLVR